MVAIALQAVVLLIGNANAAYWFQTGVRGGTNSNYNNGSSVSIETVAMGNLSMGTAAYWVGENLPNGAFLQAGYLIENQTGYYPSACNPGGCGGDELIHAGNAEWFYEYFPPGVQSSFYGGVGPDGSAGINGSFHTYGFYYAPGGWHFTFDGMPVGYASLGAAGSQGVFPVAFMEVANTSTNNEVLSPVKFLNFSVYKNGAYQPVAQGLSYIGYGAGSASSEPNPYGVQEVGSRSDYFQVGSGLVQPLNGTNMWSSSAYLSIVSEYGIGNSTSGYIRYSTVNFSAPDFAYVGPGIREKFAGWIGNGSGAYTGNDGSASVIIEGNITELATWHRQYLANATSEYSSVNGTGWYDNGTLGRFSIGGKYYYAGNGRREEFTGWSNGNSNLSFQALVIAPVNVQALWKAQYLVNGTADYGNVSGGGWYDAGSVAELALGTEYVNVSPEERFAFYNWSGGQQSSRVYLTVNAPVSLHANFLPQYMAEFQGRDFAGGLLTGVQFYINNQSFGSSGFLYSGRSYTVTGAAYKGVSIPLDQGVSVDSAAIVNVKMPVYSIGAGARDMLGFSIPEEVNASFANGTSEYFSAPSGSVSMADVPLGYANLTVHVEYGISPQTARIRNGGVAELSFITYYDIAVLAASAALVCMAAYVLVKRRGASNNKVYR